MSRRSRYNLFGDNRRRCWHLVFYKNTPSALASETGPQRRRRIADLNRAERLAPSPRARARMEAAGFIFRGIVRTSRGFDRWCERWDKAGG